MQVQLVDLADRAGHPGFQLVHLGVDDVERVVREVDPGLRRHRRGAREQAVVRGHRVRFVVHRSRVIEHLRMATFVVVDRVGRNDPEVQRLERSRRARRDAFSDQLVDRLRPRIGRVVRRHGTPAVRGARRIVVLRAGDAEAADERRQVGVLAERLGDGAEHRCVGAARIEVLVLGSVHERPANESERRTGCRGRRVSPEQRGSCRREARRLQPLAARDATRAPIFSRSILLHRRERSFHRVAPSSIPGSHPRVTAAGTYLVWLRMCR